MWADQGPPSARSRRTSLGTQAGVQSGGRRRVLAAAVLLAATALLAACTAPRDDGDRSSQQTASQQDSVTVPPLSTDSSTSDTSTTLPAATTRSSTSTSSSTATTSTPTTTASSTSTTSSSSTETTTTTSTSTESTPTTSETSGAATGFDADGNAVVWGETAAAAVNSLHRAVDDGTADADGKQPGLTILVPATPPKGFATAIDAARSLAGDVGARVQEVAGADPRADPKAIKALAANPPQRVIGFGPDFGPVDRFTARVATAVTGVQLPGGGQVMFPYRTLVALYGYPGSTALGALGQQDLDAAITRAQKVASGFKKWVDGPIVPTFEVIATVATAGAGADGDYSAASTVAKLRPWVEAATAAGMYVVLDLQPGRASLLKQANMYADLLRLPNVGLALDPEWKLAPGQKPLQQIGGVDASEVNSVIDWLGRLTAANHLPQKVLVLHQFKLSMLRDESTIRTDNDNVAVLIHMDGQGSSGGKEATWKAVVAAAPPGVVFGWKNFFVKDKPMYTPQQTMDRKLAPVMISYQ